MKSLKSMGSLLFLQVLLLFFSVNHTNSMFVVPYELVAQETEYKPSHESYEYPPHPFHFGYDVLDEHGNKQQRQEEGDHHGNVKGSYGYTDSHGVYRHVDYVADHSGFRAVILTNEPGVSNEDPAHVKLTAKPAPSHVYEQQYKKLEGGYSNSKVYLKALSKPLYKESLY